MTQRLHKKFCLHPLLDNEEQTCQSILEKAKDSNIVIMPNHHVTDYGDLAGFYFRCDKKTKMIHVPVSRRMFFGHTVVECNAAEDKIWELIINKEKNRERMKEFLQTVKDECIPARLNCIPENDMYINLYNCSHESITQDSEHWTPEVPERIGIYHAMIRGYNREIRTHKLFLICSGGLVKAADEFSNLIIDVGNDCDAETCVNSEEVWWLRKSCSRARRHLLCKLAQFFEIDIVSVDDIEAKKPRLLAIPFSDCIDQDIFIHSNTKEVCVLNGCVDTTRPIPGVLSQMHAAEGYWFFRTSQKMGLINLFGCFPSMQPKDERGCFSYSVLHDHEKIV